MIPLGEGDSLKYIPQKIHMESKHGGLEDDFPVQLRDF